MAMNNDPNMPLGDTPMLDRDATVVGTESGTFDRGTTLDQGTASYDSAGGYDRGGRSNFLAYLIGGLGYGTYNGSIGTILAFIGVGALYTLTIGLGTRLLQTLIGPAGLFASLAIFVFLNIPSLGATYTANMLAPLWRFLNGFWVGAQTVDIERSVLYFGGSDIGTDFAWLGAWAVAIVALLFLAASREPGRSSAAPALRPGHAEHV